MGALWGSPPARASLQPPPTAMLRGLVALVAKASMQNTREENPPVSPRAQETTPAPHRTHKRIRAVFDATSGSESLVFPSAVVRRRGEKAKGSGRMSSLLISVCGAQPPRTRCSFRCRHHPQLTSCLHARARSSSLLAATRRACRAPIPEATTLNL